MKRMTGGSMRAWFTKVKLVAAEAGKELKMKSRHEDGGSRYTAARRRRNIIFGNGSFSFLTLFKVQPTKF